MMIMVIIMNYAPNTGNTLYDARLQENQLRTERALMLAKLGIKDPSLKQVWKDRVHGSLGRPSGDRRGRPPLARTLAGLAVIVGATFWLFEVLGYPLPALAIVPLVALLSGEVLIISSYMPQY
jgi:hypothetical protein